MLRYGMFIYNTLKTVSSIAVILCTLTSVYYLGKIVKCFFQGQKLSFSDCVTPIRDLVGNIAGGITKPLLIVSLIATIITSTAVHQLVGVHNLLLKPEGTYCFYVEANRYGGNTYVLPAQIRVEKDTEEVSEGRNKTFTYYYIEKVFFSNGGWLDTEDSEPTEINESTYYYDYDADDEWELVLLNEHAYSPYVTETNNADWLDNTFLLIKVISICFSLFALCYREKPKEAKHPSSKEGCNSSSVTTYAEETIFSMEADNGMMVRVPESKLDEWVEEQERIKKMQEHGELTEREKMLRDRILLDIYGPRSDSK